MFSTFEFSASVSIIAILARRWKKSGHKAFQVHRR